MDVLAYVATSSAAVAASWARMGIALAFSVLFSFLVGTLAGTNKFFERIAIPVLDVLQSIPILGFFPVAITLFYTIFPVIGAEMAAIFLIFTSQVWNITFAVYEGTRLIKSELLDTARFLGISWFEKFRYLYVPATLPRVLYNLQPSWANGIFFLVGSEILTFGETEMELFGLGTVVSRYTVEGDTVGVLTTLFMLVLATLITTLLVFLPLTQLTEPRRKPRKEMQRYVNFVRRVLGPAFRTVYQPSHLIFFEYNKAIGQLTRRVSLSTSLARGVLFFLLGGLLIALLISRGEELLARFSFLAREVSEVGLETLAVSSLYSLGRVAAAVSFSVAWSLPAAIFIARRERLSATATTFIQILASIPVTVVYPVFASQLAGQPELRAFLMTIAATQYYVFFQVYAGVKNIPKNELELTELLGLKTLDRIRNVYIPRALPPLVTGCITAAGGAWNSLVVSERLVLGDVVAETDLPGLGKLLSLMTYEGNLVGSVVVITVMSSLIVLMNRLFWKRLYDVVISRLKIQEEVEK
ncbi:MAG: ABC transporter permease subunit [Candidatus Caldarchaeum sp.]